MTAAYDADGSAKEGLVRLFQLTLICNNGRDSPARTIRQAW